MQDQICDQGLEAVCVDGCDGVSRETDTQVAEQGNPHKSLFRLRSLRRPGTTRPTPLEHERNEPSGDPEAAHDKTSKVSLGPSWIQGLAIVCVLHYPARSILARNCSFLQLASVSYLY